MNDLPQTSKNEWATGWPIVLSSLIGIALCLSPLPYWALIIIGSELGKEFGWSREIITAGFLYMTAGVLVGAPIAGQLVDKFGARKVLLPSIVALSVGVCSFSLMTANPIVFYGIFFLTAFFGAATLPITWSKAIVNNFDQHRGLALGIALTGTGLYGFLAPTYIQTFIDSVGWRGAYIAVGVLPIIFSLPLALFLFRDEKEEVALKAAGNQTGFLKTYGKGFLVAAALFAVMSGIIMTQGPVWVIVLMLAFLAAYVGFVYFRSNNETHSVSELPGLTLRETFHNYRFWVIFFSFLVLGAVVSGIIANSKYILLDKGYTDITATGFFTGAGLIGLSTLVGRLIGGWLVDHFWAPMVAFVFMSVPAIGCFILMQDYSVGVNAIALILVGLAAGVEFDMMAYFTSRYFGMKSYGRVYGLVYAAFGLGSGTSPVIFNIIRGDDTDYARVLVFAAVGFVLGGAMLLTLGKYRNFESDIA
ncbi:MFS transporter [Litorimonas taeanensis]|uniref:MFS transporter n=1 Tax=Litorimonas taeanensis TaxID=568099 RepID=A0A420WM32_9PROT|nr:MFS transporter [Litorimonas taeanensis]RKQ71972.1 MFS transporter [Litorimonas taeanensis]